MSAKLYREMIEFLRNQRNVLDSFEKDNKILMANNVEVIRVISTLRDNLNLLEENINKILDKEN